MYLGLVNGGSESIIQTRNQRLVRVQREAAMAEGDLSNKELFTQL